MSDKLTPEVTPQLAVSAFAVLHQMHILRTLPGMLHGVSGRSGRGNQKITKQRIKLESRYLPALF